MLCIAHLHHYMYILSGNYYVLVTNECFKYLSCKFMKFEAKHWYRKVEQWINNENSLLWSPILLNLCLLRHSKTSPGAKRQMTHISLISTTQVRSWCINGFSSVRFVDCWFFCYSLFMHKITFSALHNDRKFLNCKVLQMWWILLKFCSIISSQFKWLPHCASFVP